MSGRLTPAAATLIRTSSAPGRGTGRSTRARPPSPSATTANIVEGMLVTQRLIDLAALPVNDSSHGLGRPFSEQAGRPAGRAGKAGPRPHLDRGAPGAHRSVEGRDRPCRGAHAARPGPPL